MTSKSNSCSGYLFDCGIDKEPVLISACLLGVPCRWHGRRPKKREALIERLKKKYVLIPVCPEQLGGMPTPRTGEKLHGTGADVLDGRLRIIAPETGKDVTKFHVNGARYTLEIVQIVGARRAYLKGGSPSCDREGVTGEILKRWYKGHPCSITLNGHQTTQLQQPIALCKFKASKVWRSSMHKPIGS